MLRELFNISQTYKHALAILLSMADWNKLSGLGNVEDRRGAGPLIAGGGGLGLVGVIIAIVFSFLGGGSPDLNSVLQQLQQTQGVQQETGKPNEFEGLDSYEKFTAKVLGSNNVLWGNIFAENNLSYREPKLVLFRAATQSGCGLSTSQVGPHYCPIDNTIYIDETFFDELTTRFGAQGGDVAEAYVIAHEVAHHVQNELGTMDQVQLAQQNNPSRANELSIQLELQADCFAGVWAYSVANQGVFEQGEIKEAIDAAAAVGDDRIQQSTRGRTNPETWTHGSSEQRVEWFNKGFETGNPAECNTFESI